jgi:hypothetical protein
MNVSTVGRAAAMPVELTSEQHEAIQSEGVPMQMVDPRSGSVYVLVKSVTFERVKSLLSDDLSDTYRAQIESAMRAGWDDPLLDQYNDYDSHKKK